MFLLYSGLELLVGLGYIVIAQQLFQPLLQRTRVLGTLEIY